MNRDTIKIGGITFHLENIEGVVTREKLKGLDDENKEEISVATNMVM